MSRGARHRYGHPSDGRPAGASAHELRELVARHLENLEVVGSVAVVPYSTPGSFGLDIDIVDGPSLWLEATETTWNSVRILDPDGEDVTLHQALDYLTLRQAGETPGEALKAVTAPKHRR